MEAYENSEAIELEPRDVAHLPDDGVAAATDRQSTAGRDLIEQHPFLTIGAAVAAGYLIARGLRRV